MAAPAARAASPAAMAPSSIASDAAYAAPSRPKLQAMERAAPQAAADASVDTPERELERIAKLREEGRDAEAEAALKRFRERYPDFRIPEAMAERLKARAR